MSAGACKGQRHPILLALEFQAVLNCRVWVTGPLQAQYLLSILGKGSYWIARPPKVAL